MTTRTPRSIPRPFTPPPPVPPPPPPPGGKKSAMKTPVPPPRSRSGTRIVPTTPISATPFDALSRKDMGVSPERAALMADIRNKPPLRRLDQSQIRDFSSAFPVTGNLSPQSSGTLSPTSQRPYSASPGPHTCPSSSGNRIFRSRERSSTREATSRSSDVLSPIRSPSRANYDSVLGVGLYPSAEKLYQQGHDQRQRQPSTRRSAHVTPTPRPESTLNGRKREAPKPPSFKPGCAPWISASPSADAKDTAAKWESYAKKTLYSAETKSYSSRSQSHSGPRNPTFFEAAVLDIFDQVGKTGQARTRGPAPVPPQLHSGALKSYLRSNTDQNSDFHTRFALHLDLDVEMILPPNFTGMKKTYPSLQRFIDDSVL